MYVYKANLESEPGPVCPKQQTCLSTLTNSDWCIEYTVHMHTRIPIHTCKYIYTHACRYYIYIMTHAYTHTYAHIQIHMNICRHVHDPRACAQIHTHTQAFTQYIGAYTCGDTPHTHEYRCIQIQENIHVHGTHTHTQISTNSHVHTCTHRHDIFIANKGRSIFSSWITTCTLQRPLSHCHSPIYHQRAPNCINVLWPLPGLSADI